MLAVKSYMNNEDWKVIGRWIKFIVSLRNFVDLGFSLSVASITWVDSFGFRNILFTLGFFDILCMFFLCFRYIFRNLHSYCCKVIVTFIQTECGKLDLSFDLSIACLSMVQCFLHITFIFFYRIFIIIYFDCPFQLVIDIIVSLASFDVI